MILGFKPTLQITIVGEGGKRLQWNFTTYTKVIKMFLGKKYFANDVSSSQICCSSWLFQYRGHFIVILNIGRFLEIVYIVLVFWILYI